MTVADLRRIILALPREFDDVPVVVGPADPIQRANAIDIDAPGNPIGLAPRFAIYAAPSDNPLGTVVVTYGPPPVRRDG